MDANQTRFHLLLSQGDWSRCTTPDGKLAVGASDAAVAWDSARNELTLRPELFRFTAAPRDVKPRPGEPDKAESSDRRGAARDRFGNWYFLSADRREILVHSVGCKETTHFWSTGDGCASPTPSTALFQPTETPPAFAPAMLSGLAVTEDHYLVVGTLEPKGLLVFDLHAGGPPRPLLWPEPVPFAPFDLAPRPHGGVWILDRQNKRFWALDRHFCVLTQDQFEVPVSAAQPDEFQPAETGPLRCSGAARTFPEGILLDDASPLSALDPVALEPLSADTVLILDLATPGSPSRLLLYRFGHQQTGPILCDERGKPLAGVTPGELRLRAYDFAFLPEADEQDKAKLGRLCFVAEEGNQVFCFVLRLAGQEFHLVPRLEYLPMRLFTGMGLVAAGGQLFYDSQGRWVPLVKQDRPRHQEEATLLTQIFDGHEPQCVWHRLMLDACLPPETEVRIWSRAADEKAEAGGTNPLNGAAWEQEPELYRRGDGSELPFTPRPDSPYRGTYELLFQKAKGRYLQLQLRLAGNGRVTPRLRALRIYYPRFSYLNHYLPAVYREDAASASFLDRFLANIEGLNTALEDKLAAVQMLFDVRSAPADALAWLASWFGVALDPAWDERRQRLFIGHAMEFFQWRGTPRGLRMALRLVMEDEPDEHIFAPPGAERCCAAAGATRQLSRRACRGDERFRIVEKFRTRRAPGVVFGDPTEAAGPRTVSPGGRWVPEKGVAELQRRFQAAFGRTDWTFGVEPTGDAQEAAARAAFAKRELGFVPSDPTDELFAWRNFLRGRYHDIAEFNTANASAWENFDDIPLPADRPAGERLPGDWRAFQTASAGQPFGVRRRMWQDFLARRYSSVPALNLAHGTQWESFATVAYPASLPADEKPLGDWFQFEAVVLPTLAVAHQFSVLLPFSGHTATAEEDRAQRFELARRLIDLEKPAHTTFDVKFFWALFRLGEARLGQDTVLGLGGRDPALRPNAVLGQTYLAESRLAAGPPFDVTDRQIVGRDRLC